MSGIHPVSAALLLAVAVALAVLCGVALTGAVRRWRRARREQSVLDDDPVIDLTYFHEATRVFREASQRLDHERAAGEGRPQARSEAVSRPAWAERADRRRHRVDAGRRRGDRGQQAWSAGPG